MSSHKIIQLIFFIKVLPFGHSGHLGHITQKILFPLSTEAHINLASIHLAVSVIFENGGVKDRWMKDHRHTISSPCEPLAQVSYK